MSYQDLPIATDAELLDPCLELVFAIEDALESAYLDEWLS